MKNIAAGQHGSVYAASLTVTAGDGRRQQGRGRLDRRRITPSGPIRHGFPVTFLTGTPLWLDSAGPLYAAIGAGNLRAWIDGTDDVGHAALAN